MTTDDTQNALSDEQQRLAEYIFVEMLGMMRKNGIADEMILKTLVISTFNLMQAATGGPLACAAWMETAARDLRLAAVTPAGQA